MTKDTRNVKRAYRRFCKSLGWDHRVHPGVIDRRLSRYMGYTVPISFRDWAKTAGSAQAYGWRVRKGLESSP